jgi:hypothetical protein
MILNYCKIKLIYKRKNNKIMAKFVAYLQQNGGCDYTIACGCKLINLKSDHVGGCLDEIENLLQYQYYGEQELYKVTLIEVVGQKNVDVKAIYKDIKKKKVASEDEQKRIKDYEEYQRLKKQFEDK